MGDTPNAFDVTVNGPDHGGFDAGDGGAGLLDNELVVVHQQADAAIVDHDLRWQIDAGRVTRRRTTRASGARGPGESMPRPPACRGGW